MTLVHGRDLKEDLYKILHSNMKHYGYRWRLGVNVDPLPWNPKGSCEPGGLYFTTFRNLGQYSQSPYDENLIGRITVDDDEPVWQEHQKWKAHRVTLSDVVAVRDLPDREYYHYISQNFYGVKSSCMYNKDTHDELWNDLLRRNPSIMHYIRPKDWRMCFANVGLTKPQDEYDPSVKEDKEELLRAVHQNPWIVKFLKNIDKDIAMRVVQWNGRTLKFIKQQTEAMCLEAVNDTYLALDYVHDQTDAVCLAAINRTWLALNHIRDKKPHLIDAALSQSGHALQFVPETMQTQEMCIKAVHQDHEAIKHVAPKFRYLFVNDNNNTKEVSE